MACPRGETMMMMIANVLIPLDGSALAERALPYAAGLAGAAKARLRLLHVIPPTPPPFHPRAEGNITARLDLLARQLRARDVQATASTLTSYAPADAILAAASDPPADLIVMSTHGRGGIGRWLYGSVADRILRRSDVPVLLVPAASNHPWPHDRRPKILVPLDGSDLSETALGPARMLSYTLGADLILLRVVEPQAVPMWNVESVAMAAWRATADELDAARQYLDGVAGAPGSAALSVDALVDEGDPAAVIAATTQREGVDLIVMATHGRTGLPRLTMGSVATTTVQRAHVPLLLIRPPLLERPLTEHTGDMDVSEADELAAEVWPPIGTR